MYIGADFPLYDMIEVVNDALKYLGTIPVPDTSITTADDQTEYTLPIAIKGREILDVEIQTITDDADDNQFFPVDSWESIPARRLARHTVTQITDIQSHCHKNIPYVKTKLWPVFTFRADRKGTSVVTRQVGKARKGGEPTNA